MIYQNFSNLSVEEIIEGFNNFHEMAPMYMQELWGLLLKRKDLTKITEKNFKTLLESKKIPLTWILKQSTLVKQFDEVIAMEFISNKNNIELVINNLTNSKANNYYFPNSLGCNDYYTLAEKYLTDIERVNDRIISPNLNYVRLINQKTKGLNNILKVDPMLELKSTNTVEKLEQELFQRKVEISTVNYGVVTTKQALIEEVGKGNPVGLVDVEYIKKHHDFDSVFKIIRSLSYFLTADGRLNLQFFKNVDSTPLVSLFVKQIDSQYEESISFKIKNHIVLHEFNLLFQVLEEFSITPYDIIQNFFMNYLKEKFDISWIDLDLPKGGESNKNNNKILFPMHEAILKQWELYAKWGGIDPDLYKISQGMENLVDIDTVLNNKYALLTKNGYEYADILFSDQSILTHYSNQIKERSFFLNVYYHPGQISTNWHNGEQDIQIEKLLKAGLISVENDRLIFSTEQLAINIMLRQLWINGAINTYQTDNLQKSDEVFYFDIDEALNKMKEMGIIEFHNRFFEPGEVDYLNYLLNNKTFSNSLGIRNKYAHDYFTENVDEYKRDNLYALLVIFFLAIKIDEELSFHHYKGNGISV